MNYHFVGSVEKLQQLSGIISNKQTFLLIFNIQMSVVHASWFYHHLFRKQPDKKYHYIKNKFRKFLSYTSNCGI